jgi:peptidoglycan/xylan/chitin deacetylase (PgdA/CDA1 family)
MLRVSRAIGLNRLARRLTRRGLRVLCYHGIWSGHSKENRWNFLYMSPQRFAGRMRRLTELGYPVLPLGEALQRVQQGTLPANAVAITIDDGWHSTGEFMVPVLQKLQLPATIYLTTYYVEKGSPVFDVALAQLVYRTSKLALRLSDIGFSSEVEFILSDGIQRTLCVAHIKRLANALPSAEVRLKLLGIVAARLEVDLEAVLAGRPFHLMSPEDVRQAASGFIDFQLHTHRHRISLGDQNTLAQEIEDNRQALDRLLGPSSQRVHFCYPSGIFRPDCADILRQAGVVSATTTDSGFVWQDSNPYALPRILDGESVSDAEFEAELSGLLEISRIIARTFKRFFHRDGG